MSEDTEVVEFFNESKCDKLRYVRVTLVMETIYGSNKCQFELYEVPEELPVNVDNEVTDNHDRHVAFRTSKYPRMYSKIGPYVEMDSILLARQLNTDF
jgi:hypothetical protein